MAKEKTKKNYTLTVVDGKYTFKVIKTADGKAHSMVGQYPVVMQTEEGIKRLTRKQLEKFCVEYAKENGWFAADGK